MAAHQAPVPGIIQATTLEWVVIAFSSAWKWKVKVKSLSRVRLFATPWTVAYQAPTSMGFPRQEYWSGLPLPSPRWSLLTGKFFIFRIQKCSELFCTDLRQWQPTPVLLPGKSHGQRNLVGYSPWGHEELDRTDQLHFHFSLSCIGEGNGNPLQCSCLENPRDGSLVGCRLWGRIESNTTDVT